MMLSEKLILRIEKLQIMQRKEYHKWKTRMIQQVVVVNMLIMLISLLLMQGILPRYQTLIKLLNILEKVVLSIGLILQQKDPPRLGFIKMVIKLEGNNYQHLDIKTICFLKKLHLLTIEVQCPSIIRSLIHKATNNQINCT